MSFNPPRNKTGWPAGAQLILLGFALLLGVLAGFLLRDDISSLQGWAFAVFALNFARMAQPRSPESVVRFDISTRKVVAILALCTLPPLALMLFFAHPGSELARPLVFLFLVCISVGPYVLLRHYSHRSTATRGDRASRNEKDRTVAHAPPMIDR